MKQETIISVIIPIYNADKYLRRCLDSLLVQTFSNFEAILVNDGSTDNSLEICEEYALIDKRIKLIRNQNGGPSKARNQGLELVTTKWVTFIDADDYVEPSYLENFVRYNANDIETQVIQGYYTVGYNNDSHDTLYPDTKYKHHIAKEGERSSYIEKENILYNWAVWCKVFSIEIIRKHNLQFENNIWSCEDGVFWHNYLCHIKKLIFIEEQGYYYFCPRVYDSVSRNGKHKPNIDGYITLSKNYKYISTILPRKFKMSNRYASFFKMQYLQNYFKAILTQTTLTDEHIVRLENIRPPKNYFIPNKKGILLWVANLFSIKFIRFISSFISR